MQQAVYKVVINIEMNLLLVLFKPSTTSMPFYGDLTPLSIMMLYACANIDNKYSTVAQHYCSAQPSLFYYIVLVLENNTFLF